MVSGTELGRRQAEHSQGELVALEGTVPLGPWQIPLSDPTVVQVCASSVQISTEQLGEVLGQSLGQVMYKYQPLKWWLHLWHINSLAGSILILNPVSGPVFV